MAPSCDTRLAQAHQESDTCQDSYEYGDQRHFIAAGLRKPLVQRQSRFDSGEYYLAQEGKQPLDGLSLTAASTQGHNSHMPAGPPAQTAGMLAHHMLYQPMAQHKLVATSVANGAKLKASRLASCTR